MRFAFDAKARTWHGGDPGLTAFFNAMSLLFPDGEAFFIESVKHYRDRVSDPALQEQVSGFIAQESLHRREHARWNDLLQAQGYPADYLTKRSRLEWSRQLFGPFERLALTAAMEHCTSISSRVFLSDPRVFAGVEPTMARLWRWHALEEVEHRAVAFDVFRVVAGQGLYAYLVRCLVLFAATVFFTGRLVLNTRLLLKADGLHWSGAAWGSILRFCFWRPALMPRLLFAWLDFFRPGFHPLQHRSDELVAAARREMGPVEPPALPLAPPMAETPPVSVAPAA